jgi:hypothetical protein
MQAFSRSHPGARQELGLEDQRQPAGKATGEGFLLACGKSEAQVLCSVGQPVEDAQAAPVCCLASIVASQQAQPVTYFCRCLPVLCCYGRVQSCLQLVKVCNFCQLFYTEGRPWAARLSCIV